MNAIASLVSTLGGLYLLAILLRFLLQIARADFYNPLSQSVVRITDPVVRIFRNFIPGYRGIDFSCLVLALLVEGLLIVALSNLYGPQLFNQFGLEMPGIGSIISWSVAGVILFILNIYFYAILATIIMSFVMLFSGSMNPHPILQLIWQLTEPVMAPIRNVIPPMGGLDFSPIFIFLGIEFLSSFLMEMFGISGPVRLVIVGV